MREAGFKLFKIYEKMEEGLAVEVTCRIEHALGNLRFINCWYLHINLKTFHKIDKEKIKNLEDALMFNRGVTYVEEITSDIFGKYIKLGCDFVHFEDDDWQKGNHIEKIHRELSPKYIEEFKEYYKTLWNILKNIY